jgi:hypothetical protein
MPPRWKRLSILAGLMLVLMTVPMSSFPALGEVAMREVSGRVLQIAQETVYIDLGLNQGVEVDQVLRILRRGDEVGRVQVVRVSASFSACVAESAGIVPTRGDHVVGLVALSAPDTTPVPDTTAAIPSGTNADVTEKSVRITEDHRTQFSGKVALRHVFLDDRSESNRDVRQSSALLDIEADQIQGAPISFSLRMRGHHYGSGIDRQPSVRLYDLEFRVGSDRYAAAVGRLNPPSISGVGEFDGMHVSGRIGRNTHTGIFAGFQPEARGSAFQTRIRRAGLYASYAADLSQPLTQRATVAFVGEYDRSAIGREYLYLQYNARWGRTFSIYQQAEVDLDRSNHSETMAPVQLSNALIGFRYYPSRMFSFSAGYDARRFVPALTDDLDLDLQIDRAFRQGLRADLRFRPWRTVSLYVRGNLRLRDSERATKAISGNMSLTRLPLTGGTLRSRLTYTTGAYANTKGLSAGLGRSIGRLLYVGADWGRYTTNRPQSEYRDVRSRLSANLHVYLPGRWFAAVSHDRYTGSVQQYSYTFLELSTRL